MSQSFIQSGKKPREELYLPPLRYVALDNWVEVLGHDAFIAWLKLHTWVDRRDENRDNDRIPYALEDVWEKLGMGKKKFYLKVLRPLWEYGLVDVVEYEKSKRKSQKPKNIIVYTSPANTSETETKPLKKLRDWDKDYGSASQYFGKKGGRPKKQGEDHGFQTETVESTVSKRKPSTVSKRKPSTVSKRKPNNVSNALTNSSNALTNVSNNNNQEASPKETVVVKEIQQIFSFLLDEEITTYQGKKIEQEIKAFGYDQPVKAVVTDAVHLAQQRHGNLTNPMGAVLHEIQTGLSPIKKANKEDSLPKAVAQAMEQEASGETPKSGKVDPETEARLQAKWNRMKQRIISR